MRMIDREKTCCRKVNQSEGRYVYNVKCAAKQLPIQITVLTFIVGNIQDSRLSSETEIGEILARFNTEEQVRAAFLITRHAMQRLPFTEKIFTKTSKHEKTYTCYRLPRAGCFNNELRLEHNTVERKDKPEHLHHF
jgi:hypothetical protein